MVNRGFGCFERFCGSQSEYYTFRHYLQDAVTVQREDLMEEILGNMKILRTAKLDAYLDVKTVLDSDIVVRNPHNSAIL